MAPRVLAAASGANARTIGPTPPPILTPVFIGSGASVTVVGNTEIVAPGDAIVMFDGPGALNINTESALAPPGPISITSTTGSGVVINFPFAPTTASINSGPHGDVTIDSGGAALASEGENASLTASNANGGQLIFHSTAPFGVVAQFGATINLTGAANFVVASSDEDRGDSAVGINSEMLTFVRLAIVSQRH